MTKSFKLLVLNTILFLTQVTDDIQLIKFKSNFEDFEDVEDLTKRFVWSSYSIIVTHVYNVSAVSKKYIA